MAHRPWFPWYPGDYMRDTAHLSALEDCFYRRLIDHYMSKGEPLRHDRLYAVARAHSQDEKNAVDRVKTEFLVPMADGLHIPRCDAEIEKWDRFIASQRARALRRWGDATAMPRHARAMPTTSTTTSTSTSTPRSKAGATARPLRGSRLPPNWIPGPEGVKFCREERPDLDANAVLEEFRDYWHAQPGQKGVKVDWMATWRNWVRRQRVKA